LLAPYTLAQTAVFKICNLDPPLYSVVLLCGETSDVYVRTEKV